ncbi:hypothetical protein FRC17_009978 [Serendipita sp. 399]|nr:hypothetical protein FRC17_009978 [Serendipita sp. 399]
MATLGEPLVLSRHDISPKTKSTSRPLTASCSKGAKDEYASIGIGGEGISIIDLTSLQPDAAALLGPETTFACSPVSRTITDESGHPLRQTYAVTESSSADSSSNVPIISYWTSSAALSSLEKHRTVTLEKPVKALYAPHWQPASLIVASMDGDILSFDSRLEEATVPKKKQSSKRTLISSFIFDPSSSSLEWKHKEPKSSILLSVIQDAKRTSLRQTFVGSSIEHGEELSIQLGTIISASCESSSCISFFCKDGTLSSYLLDSHQGQLFASQLDSLRIRSFHNESASLLCLGSTHILLAGVTRDAGDIAILLWDVQYSVLLSEHRLPTPSNLSSLARETLRLQLIHCNDAQSLLIITPDLSLNRPSQLPAGAKSNVLLIPHTVPQKSSLANVIGKADAGKAWLAPLEDDKPDVLDEQRESILRALSEALQAGNVEATDTIFFDWVTEQTAAVKAAAKAEAKRHLAVALGKIPPDGEMPEGMEIDKEEHLTDMDDVLLLLDQLNKSMRIAIQGNDGSLTLGNLEKEFKEHEDRKRLTKHGKPRLEMIVSFLSTLLDAKLLDITQYPATHNVLRQLYEFILPQIAWLSMLEKLRGPLEPFVVADKKGNNKQQQSYVDNFAPKQQKWKEKKADSYALTVGLYQLEEFTI